jgi:hypothetical protein
VAINLSPSELEQRVAILKRFRELLLRQREKFQNYLVLLDKEKLDIERGDADSIQAHVDIERDIVMDITTLQKVINPLEDMYNEAYPQHASSEIPELKRSMSELQKEVVRRHYQNKELLKEKMEELRQEIKDLHHTFKQPNKVYSSAPEPSIIDIRS